MKIVFASSNKHKLKEIKDLLSGFEIYAFDEVLKPFEIDEIGKSFKENALIKSRAVFEALNAKQRAEFVVLSDDSGLSVAALDNKPGIHSARFSAQGDDGSNRTKLIKELEKLDLKESKAHYTACIALSSNLGEFYSHGFLHGRVIDTQKGQNGFGYDSLFIPNGFNQTLGELDESVKRCISHRFRALSLSQIWLNTFCKGKK
ncbi:non-canonical purine NTP pyrophosphatase [Campylobacter sp. MIT 12-5580]|uniref:non-canonical purine NTP pyrophosphatase n=1 Tax=Campylobacter sp. MIT 12-5580 TaxID=2040651 RepID=UPI0010F778D4|nr:non-canonical purine NTP pyrophosphatase [Campylobacter sp. MIT 12-5580]TKX30067.1 non-canonical purine NTP pyrophosphatase [Campylobacter sp. MIT 12-5580]